MFYYLYEIKNLVNGKIYVGVHKTKNIDDNYMGSGKVILSAIEKYGIWNFEKNIIKYFNNSIDMFLEEMCVVDDVFLGREDTYNLRRGGYGGFDFINNNKDENYIYIRKENAKNLNVDNPDRYVAPMGAENPFYMHSHYSRFDLDKQNQANATKLSLSDESKAKRKKTFIRIGHQQGCNNSQSGTMWITDGVSNKKIKANDVIPDRFNRGRMLKNKAASI